MKLFPGRDLTKLEAVYNYRLSRARRTIDNAIGVWPAQWRILGDPLKQTHKQ